VLVVVVEVYLLEQRVRVELVAVVRERQTTPQQPRQLQTLVAVAVVVATHHPVLVVLAAQAVPA
jgi:hypothetical protein